VSKAVNMLLLQQIALNNSKIANLEIFNHQKFFVNKPRKKERENSNI